jgi:hypothetical protein
MRAGRYNGRPLPQTPTPASSVSQTGTRQIRPTLAKRDDVLCKPLLYEKLHSDLNWIRSFVPKQCAPLNPLGSVNLPE